jgi:hypothetical protein
MADRERTIAGDITGFYQLGAQESDTLLEGIYQKV